MYKYIIASYTHFLNGKHTNLGGPAQHLKKYLKYNAYAVWQPIPIGKPTWVYALLKLRDIWLVLTRHKPAKVFIGIESINALLGRLLGYKRVIYWNMDYSPSRGYLWHFLDRLAIKYADEVWVLKDRGLPKQKVVPIGCWYYEIKRNYKRDELGVVYIGLLEDMQGLGGLLRLAPWYNITIIGTGKHEKKYKNMNLPNVRFLGVLSDKEAQEVMCHNTWGWDIYHPDNPTIKTTLPTKPMTYASCGLRLMSMPDLTRKQMLSYARKHDWNRIFKEVLDV